MSAQWDRQGDDLIARLEALKQQLSEASARAAPNPRRAEPPHKVGAPAPRAAPGYQPSATLQEWNGEDRRASRSVYRARDSATAQQQQQQQQQQRRSQQRRREEDEAAREELQRRRQQEAARVQSARQREADERRAAAARERQEADRRQAALEAESAARREQLESAVARAHKLSELRHQREVEREAAEEAEKRAITAEERAWAIVQALRDGLKQPDRSAGIPSSRSSEANSVPAGDGGRHGKHTPESADTDTEDEEDHEYDAESAATFRNGSMQQQGLNFDAGSGANMGTGRHAWDRSTAPPGESVDHDEPSPYGRGPYPSEPAPLPPRTVSAEMVPPRTRSSPAGAATSSVEAPAEEASPESELGRAISLLRRREADYGRQHPETADAVYNVALACRDASRPAQAGEFFSRAAELYAMLYGEDHEETEEARMYAAECRHRSESSTGSSSALDHNGVTRLQQPRSQMESTFAAPFSPADPPPPRFTPTDYGQYDSENEDVNSISTSEDRAGSNSYISNDMPARNPRDHDSDRQRPHDKHLYQEQRHMERQENNRRQEQLQRQQKQQERQQQLPGREREQEIWEQQNQRRTDISERKGGRERLQGGRGGGSGSGTSALPNWVKTGAPVEAPFSNGLRYPATIIDVGPNSLCTVRYDDDGAIGSVPAAELRPTTASSPPSPGPDPEPDPDPSYARSSPRVRPEGRGYAPAPVPAPSPATAPTEFANASGTEPLKPCAFCGRRFALSRLEKHQAACAKAAAKPKRAAFKAPTVPDEAVKAKAKASRSGGTMGGSSSSNGKAKPKWAAQSEQLRNAMKAAREVKKAQKAGIPLSELPPPTFDDSSQAADDRVECPHCGRKFNADAAARHIPRCKQLGTKPVGASKGRRVSGYLGNRGR